MAENGSPDGTRAGSGWCGPRCRVKFSPEGWLSGGYYGYGIESRREITRNGAFRARNDPLRLEAIAPRSAHRSFATVSRRAVTHRNGRETRWSCIGPPDDLTFLHRDLCAQRNEKDKKITHFVVSIFSAEAFTRKRFNLHPSFCLPPLVSPFPRTSLVPRVDLRQVAPPVILGKPKSGSLLLGPGKERGPGFSRQAASQKATRKQHAGSFRQKRSGPHVFLHRMPRLYSSESWRSLLFRFLFYKLVTSFDKQPTLRFWPRSFNFISDY